LNGNYIVGNSSRFAAQDGYLDLKMERNTTILSR